MQKLRAYPACVFCRQGNPYRGIVVLRIVTDQRQCWELELVPPRLARVRMLGALKGEDTEVLFDRIAAHVNGQPYWLLELDISRLEQADAHARRVAAHRLRVLPEYSVALHGAGFGQRMVAKLFLKLSEMLDRERDITNRFLDDEASAQAWLRAEGERREAKPADETRPADEAKPADEARPADEAKPADETRPGEAE